MPTFRHLVHGVTVAAILGMAPPIHAQMSGSFAAFVGYYRPLSHFDANSVILAGKLPEEPSDLSAATLGAAGHLALGHRIGVAGQLGATVDSHVAESPTPAGVRGPTGAMVIVGTLQGQFDVSPNPRAYHIWMNAGPGFVHHGGAAYRDLGSPTSLAGAVGMTFAVPIASHLQFVADATALFYGFDLPTPPSLIGGKLEHGNQRDAMVHVGVAWGHL